MKTKKPETIKILSLVIFIALLGMHILSACGSKANPSDGREAADLSGYAGMDGYDPSKEIMLRETTMAEADELMDKGESFALYFSFEDCPYCNRLIPYLNDAAIEAGEYIEYIDTRSNPQWSSNMDIDDYDKVVERFGDYLDEDPDGSKHLYVPDIYFIRDGKVVARHEGVTPGADDPNQELTPEQEDSLMSDLAAGFASIKSELED